MYVTEMITWIYVSDLDRSRLIYEQGLGFKPLIDQGDCLVLGNSSGSYLGLCCRPPPRTTAGLLLCFIDQDVVGRTDRLVTLGATLEQPPSHNPKYGITHAFLRDPDGHRIEVQKFDDPSWNLLD